MNTGKKNPLPVIVGPTAVGKTELAIEIAQALGNLEIVSADSMQVYRHMDIGTAKPTMEQRKKVPHHLIDIVEPDVDFTVADYQQKALSVLKQIYNRGNIPLLVGGTGLYVKAVIDGYVFNDQGKDPSTREKLKAKADQLGKNALYEELACIDPHSASRIHPHDLRRIIRALEVYYSTGQRISEQWRETKEGESSFQLYIVGLYMERSELYQRINLRVDRMISEGLVQEVLELLERGYSPDLKSMQSLGYRHMAWYLQGESTLEEAVRILKRDTRRFAKRQFTWFKRDPRICWQEVNTQNIASLVANICSYVEGYLNIYNE